MSSSALSLSALAMTLSLGLVLAPCSHGAGPATPTGTSAAAPAAPAAKGPATLPVFTLRDLEDKDHSSTDWKGKVVLIDFWATWCAGCRETIPALTRLKEKYGENGLAVVGVSLDKGSKSKVAKFATKYKVNYQVLLDSEDTLSKVFGFEGLPSLYLFDREGRLLKAMTGYTALQDKELEALVATQFPAK